MEHVQLLHNSVYDEWPFRKFSSFLFNVICNELHCSVWKREREDFLLVKIWMQRCDIQLIFLLIKHCYVCPCSCSFSIFWGLFVWCSVLIHGPPTTLESSDFPVRNRSGLGPTPYPEVGATECAAPCTSWFHSVGRRCHRGEPRRRATWMWSPRAAAGGRWLLWAVRGIMAFFCLRYARNCSNFDR